MVIASDRMLKCFHSVGIGQKDNAFFLMSPGEAKESEGGVIFDFCPWCSMPVKQILGERED